MQRYPVVLTALAAAVVALVAASATAAPPSPRRMGPTQAVAMPGTVLPIAARTNSIQPFPAQPLPAQPNPAQPNPAQPNPAQPNPVQPIVAASTGPDLGPMAAMTAPLTTTGHDVAMTTQGSTMVGAVDPSKNAASAAAKGSGLELDEVVASGQIFVKANLGADIDNQIGISPDVWMQLDPSQVGQDNELLIQPDGSDPVDLIGIMTGVTALRRTDAEHIQGTIDLTKVTGHTLPDPDELSRAGTSATHVPFTVIADANGRISSFQVYADTFDPALSLKVAYTHYGAPSPITVPTSSVPAPAGVYSLFNN